jgi:hypothetical protein
MPYKPNPEARGVSRKTDREGNAAATVGAVAAATFWVLGQNIGQLYSGQATDPNTGPLIILMALALAGTTEHTPARHRSPHNHSTPATVGHTDNR